MVEIVTIDIKVRGRTAAESIDKFSRRIDALIKQSKVLRADLTKTERSFAKFAKNLKDSSASMLAVSTTASQASVGFKKFNSEFAKATTKVRNAAKAYKTLADALRAIARLSRSSGLTASSFVDPAKFRTLAAAAKASEIYLKGLRNEYGKFVSTSSVVNKNVGAIVRGFRQIATQAAKATTSVRQLINMLRAAALLSGTRINLNLNVVNREAEARLQGYREEIERLSRSLRNLRRRTRSSTRGTDLFRKTIIGMGSALRGAGLVGALVAIANFTREMAIAADSIRLLEARMVALTGTASEAAGVISELNDIAVDNGVDVRDLSKLYIRTSRAVESFGGDQADAFKITRRLSEAIRLFGLSAQETNSVIIQFSQALQSGRLQGDEFRSLSEALPPLMDALAKEMGVARGELKKLGSEGKITFRELSNAAKNIDVSGVEKVTASLQGSVTNLGTAIAGLSSQIIPVETFAEIFQGLASRINLVTEAMRNLRAEEEQGKLLEQFSGLGTLEIGRKKASQSINAFYDDFRKREEEIREARERRKSNPFANIQYMLPTGFTGRMLILMEELTDVMERKATYSVEQLKEKIATVGKLTAALVLQSKQKGLTDDEKDSLLRARRLTFEYEKQLKVAEKQAAEDAARLARAKQIAEGYVSPSLPSFIPRQDEPRVEKDFAEMASNLANLFGREFLNEITTLNEIDKAQTYILSELTRSQERGTVGPNKIESFKKQFQGIFDLARQRVDIPVFDEYSKGVEKLLETESLFGAEGKALEDSIRGKAAAYRYNAEEVEKLNDIINEAREEQRGDIVDNLRKTVKGLGGALDFTTADGKAAIKDFYDYVGSLESAVVPVKLTPDEEVELSDLIKEETFEDLSTLLSDLGAEYDFRTPEGQAQIEQFNALAEAAKLTELQYAQLAQATKDLTFDDFANRLGELDDQYDLSTDRGKEQTDLLLKQAKGVGFLARRYRVLERQVKKLKFKDFIKRVEELSEQQTFLGVEGDRVVQALRAEAEELGATQEQMLSFDNTIRKLQKTQNEAKFEEIKGRLRELGAEFDLTAERGKTALRDFYAQIDSLANPEGGVGLQLDDKKLQELAKLAKDLTFEDVVTDFEDLLRNVDLTEERGQELAQTFLDSADALELAVGQADNLRQILKDRTFDDFKDKLKEAAKNAKFYTPEGEAVAAAIRRDAENAGATQQQLRNFDLIFEQLAKGQQTEAFRGILEKIRLVGKEFDLTTKEGMQALEELDQQAAHLQSLNVEHPLTFTDQQKTEYSKLIDETVLNDYITGLQKLGSMFDLTNKAGQAHAESLLANARAYGFTGDKFKKLNDLYRDERFNDFVSSLSTLTDEVILFGRAGEQNLLKILSDAQKEYRLTGIEADYLEERLRKIAKAQKEAYKGEIANTGRTKEIGPIFDFTAVPSQSADQFKRREEHFDVMIEKYKQLGLSAAAYYDLTSEKGREVLMMLLAQAKTLDLTKEELLELRIYFQRLFNEQYQEAQLNNMTFWEEFKLGAKSGFEEWQKSSETAFQEFGKQAFGAFTTLSQGIGDATAEAIVFGEDFSQSIKKVSQTILTDLISSLVQIGIQQGTNAIIAMATSEAVTKKQVANNAEITASAAPAAGAQAGASYGASALAGAAALGALAALAASAFLFEKGGAIGRGGVIPFAKGGVFDTPTAFSFGSNQLGVMGEAGPEAIMPLAKTRGGKLGVNALGGGQSAVNVNFQVINNAAGLVEVQVSESEKAIIINQAVERSRNAVRNDFNNDLSVDQGGYADAINSSYQMNRKF